MAQFTSINGITIHVCRKMVEFAFGKTNSLGVRYNFPEHQYDIYIREIQGLEKQTKYFRDFWGAGFHVIILPEDEIHTIPSTHDVSA